jgi:hypothetical protein
MQGEELRHRLGAVGVIIDEQHDPSLARRGGTIHSGPASVRPLHRCRFASTALPASHQGSVLLREDFRIPLEDIVMRPALNRFKALADCNFGRVRP